jgi:phosphatidylethanolamine-binding protein
MYILFPTAVALSFLGSFVYAQSNDTTNALGIAAIEAHFDGALIVPELIAAFDPSAIMSVNFTGVGDITPGQNLTKARE